MNRTLRFALLGVAVVGVAAGCGGNDSESAETTGTTATAAIVGYDRLPTYRVDQVMRSFDDAGVTLVLRGSRKGECAILAGRLGMFVYVCPSSARQLRIVGTVGINRLYQLTKRNVVVRYFGPLRGGGTLRDELADIKRALHSLGPGAIRIAIQG